MPSTNWTREQALRAARRYQGIAEQFSVKAQRERDAARRQELLEEAAHYNRAAAYYGAKVEAL